MTIQFMFIGDGIRRILEIFCKNFNFRLRGYPSSLRILTHQLQFMGDCTMGVARIFFGGGHIFKKFSKNFLKNFQKQSTKFQKNLKNFQKNYKNFVKKIAKNGFPSIFFKKFNKPSIQFLRVWTKNAICRQFLRKFS